MQHMHYTRSTTTLDANTDFVITEAYKTARTNLTFALSDIQGCKRVFFTSPSQGDGKTTACINIAIAFAQTKARVIVIDGDMCRPRLHQHMQLKKANGLSDVLGGLMDIDHVIKPTKHGIDVITSGQIPPNPAELLSSLAMGALLDKLGEKYDYIFVDTPPIMHVSDAVAASNFASGYVMVVRHNVTLMDMLDMSRESLMLANAKLLGYVINAVDPKEERYGRYGHYGKYKYSYKYKYGYRYGNPSTYGDKPYGDPPGSDSEDD